MKVFLSLLVLSLTLATCYGACGYYPFEAKLKDGKLVKPTGCFDPFDKSKHSFGSTWNSSHCLQCSCAETGMECCSRYGGTAQKEGCTAMVNPETCEYEFYKLDDPSKPCV